MKKIRVLVVDDSAFMRKAIMRMLSSAPDIIVLDTAADGAEAVAKAAELKPDIITMDVKMAGMDGIAALKAIMRERPTPVLMISSLTREGAEITLQALDLGAVDFIDKSRTESSMDVTLLTHELIAKVRTIAGVDVEKVRSWTPETAPSPVSAAVVEEHKPAKIKRSGKVDVVAIGTSTGGPPALQSLIPALPPDFPSAVIVVQHMPPGFTKTLAERLHAQSRIPVAEAVTGEVIQPGKVLIAPAGQHFKVVVRNGQQVVRLDAEPADAVHKPSVDVMMESIARVYGKRALGVLLTGMGSDGARGMRAIRESGGRTFAESEETCIVYGMPKSAVEDGVVDKIVPLYDMVNTILKEV